MRILVVDDNIDLADNICDALAMENYTADSAYDGESALELFKKENYDLAFLDVKLPGKNGVDCFMEMRAIQPNCKVVIMTGYRVEELVQQAIDYGALRVMHKPFEMEEVFSLVDEVKPDGIILVVDDTPSLMKTMEKLLSSAGYTICTATNGEIAIEKMTQQRSDLLLLDLRLPIMSSMEVYLKLKELNKVVPTIIVTSYSEEEIDKIKQLRSLKVSGILSKPFDPEHLLSILEETLSCRKK